MKRDFRPYVLLIAAAVVALDQWTKRLIEEHIAHGSYYTVIPGFFRLSHAYNNGAAFSLFAESLKPEVVREALIGFTVVAILAVLAMAWRGGRAASVTAVALGLILGGAAGNLYDRIHLGYVVDFLVFEVGTHRWPDFNVADSAIVVGAVLLAIEIFRPQPGEKNEAPEGL